MAEDELINKGSQVAARGTVQLLIGRVYFMAAGYVIAVVLARGLGPVAYGTYGLIMSVLLWLEVASDFGIQRATMKLIPQSDDARAIARTSAACLLAVSTSLFIVCWIAAPAIARSFNIDDGEWLIRLAIFDIPLNGLYIAYQGIMQGHRRFGAISLAMIFYSTAKLGGTLLLLVIGLSVELALVVNVLATVAALLFLATQYRPGISFASRSVVNSIVRVAAPIGLFIVANRLVMSSHLWSLKWLGDVRDETVGLYVAAWTVAQLPTMVTFVITGVLLASISGALARADSALARTYLQSAVRFVVLAVLPMCALGALDAKPIMELIFSMEYSEGGRFLALLLCSYGLFALLDTLMHAMLAADQLRRVALVQIMLIPVALVFNYLLITRFGGDGAAVALLMTLTVGVIVAWLWAARTYGPPLQGATMARAVFSTSLVCGISLFWGASGLAVLLKLSILVIIYGGALLLLRELGPRDLSALAVWKK